MELKTDSRSRIATFGVAFTAAVVAITMNRVQVSRSGSGQTDKPVQPVVAETTLPGNVVAFG